MMRKSIIAMGALIALTLASGSVLAAEKKSVEQVNKNSQALSGQQVELRGEVTKVNNGIMRRNFIHIKDGTGAGNSGSLIVTSKDTAQVGQTITVVGTVKLGTDFGMGYTYPLLVENATITVE
ncbi:MAG: hypothetical protein L3J62_06200 [Gammaproteobacteria bacterium]|nr:hypothetical protein [Gammaproteobacteria bacterium]